MGAAAFSETYTVNIKRAPEIGIVTEEWLKGGQPDRADGPAVIVRDTATGKVTREEGGRAAARSSAPQRGLARRGGA